MFRIKQVVGFVASFVMIASTVVGLTGFGGSVEVEAAAGESSANSSLEIAYKQVGLCYNIDNNLELAPLFGHVKYDISTLDSVTIQYDTSSFVPNTYAGVDGAGDDLTSWDFVSMNPLAPISSTDIADGIVDIYINTLDEAGGNEYMYSFDVVPCSSIGDGSSEGFTVDYSGSVANPGAYSACYDSDYNVELTGISGLIDSAVDELYFDVFGVNISSYDNDRNFWIFETGVSAMIQITQADVDAGSIPFVVAQIIDGAESSFNFNMQVIPCPVDELVETEIDMGSYPYACMYYTEDGFYFSPTELSGSATDDIVSVIINIGAESYDAMVINEGYGTFWYVDYYEYPDLYNVSQTEVDAGVLQIEIVGMTESGEEFVVVNDVELIICNIVDAWADDLVYYTYTEGETVSMYSCPPGFYSEEGVELVVTINGGQYVAEVSTVDDGFNVFDCWEVSGLELSAGEYPYTLSTYIGGELYTESEANVSVIFEEDLFGPCGWHGNLCCPVERDWTGVDPQYRNNSGNFCGSYIEASEFYFESAGKEFLNPEMCFEFDEYVAIGEVSIPTVLETGFYFYVFHEGGNIIGHPLFSETLVVKDGFACLPAETISLDPGVYDYEIFYSVNDVSSSPAELIERNINKNKITVARANQSVVNTSGTVVTKATYTETTPAKKLQETGLNSTGVMAVSVLLLVGTASSAAYFKKD